MKNRHFRNAIPTRIAGLPEAGPDPLLTKRMSHRLSLIIPTLNEEQNLPCCLRTAEAVLPHETIVVDGGSTDGTIKVASGAGVRVERSPPGRARQQNAGAEVATGDVLLFLHADCRLPPNAREKLEEALLDPRVGCGAFRHRIDDPRRALRVIEAADNFRAGWLKRPYGDQALFVRRKLFEQIGGFPDVQILEDVLLMRKLRRVTRFRLADAVVETDARRWARRGVVRTTAMNWTILLGAALRVPNHWLARLYYGTGALPVRS